MLSALPIDGELCLLLVQMPHHLDLLTLLVINRSRFVLPRCLGALSQSNGSVSLELGPALEIYLHWYASKALEFKR